MKTTIKRALRSKPTAFTLIELLTVIAIIAILAALLVPGLAEVRKRGKAVQCLNNLRQMSLVLFQYTQDHDGNLPEGYAAGPPVETWYIDLNAYVHYAHTGQSATGVGMYWCPSSKNSALSGWSWVSYGFNAIPQQGSNRVRLDEITRPSEKHMFVDSLSYNIAWCAQSNYDLIDFPHGARANTVMFDGHVTTITKAPYVWSIWSAWVRTDL